MPRSRPGRQSRRAHCRCCRRRQRRRSTGRWGSRAHPARNGARANNGGPAHHPTRPYRAGIAAGPAPGEEGVPRTGRPAARAARHGAGNGRSCVLQWDAVRKRLPAEYRHGRSVTRTSAFGSLRKSAEFGGTRRHAAIDRADYMLNRSRIKSTGENRDPFARASAARCTAAHESFESSTPAHWAHRSKGIPSHSIALRGLASRGQ